MHPDPASMPSPTPQRQRVLFVITTSDYGGTETYLRQLIERLDRSRFEPIFCSLCPLGRIGEEIARTGVPTFSLGMSSGSRWHEFPGAILALRREIDRRRVDLVLGLLYRANTLAALAARSARRRPIFVSGQRSLNPPWGSLMVRGVQWTRRLARHSIAVSPAVKDEMLDTETLDADSITVLRNGIDLEKWHRIDTATARRRFELPADAVVIVAAGRCTPVKGFDHLIDAVARLRAELPAIDVRLCIAGDGPELPKLETRIRERGLESAARLLGRQTHEELRALYSAADLYALTSSREGSPNAMLEAMACGCAVVATRVGGVLDIIEPERSGLLVPPEDAGALAEALAAVVRDEARRTRLAAGARARIESDFDLERMVRAHEALFERLL